MVRHWWLCINCDVKSDEIFNSREGAEGWQEDFGGIIIHVKEVKDDE